MADKANRQSYDGWCHHQTNGPQRPPAVLQHNKQQHYRRRDEQHEVEQCPYKIALHDSLAGGEKGYRQIPQMTQRHAGKEDSRPPAKAYWRRDVWRDGIGPTKQQIATGHQRHHCHCSIKHHIEEISLYLLVVHN